MRPTSASCCERQAYLSAWQPAQVLEPADFNPFFEALHGHPPFEWQQRLAEQVTNKRWPSHIKLPTASGKTATLDIAVFHLAVEAARLAERGEAMRAARRIFFVVDRRIIVNEAYERMRDDRLGHHADPLASGLGVAAKLNDALTGGSSCEKDVLGIAAGWLRWLAAAGKPDASVALDVVELRGGIYKDDAWVRSITQPTIVMSTVDQFGSRLLYRAYGVSPRTAPIHAALTSRDALVILDEAHCSNPFSESLSHRQRLDRVPDSSRGASGGLALVQMTATPPPGVEDVFGLHIEADYAEGSLLGRRHKVDKPVALVSSNASGKRWLTGLADELVDQALALMDSREGADVGCQRIAVIVNRVALAREVHRRLCARVVKSGSSADVVDLMVGAMRPIDRDRMTSRLKYVFGSNSAATLDEPQFLVSTQCIEVGADLDFDGMICQVASIDALRQRFGRLNRLGDYRHARGVIVGSEQDVKLGADDFIYGTAMPEAWRWLHESAEDNHVNFGVSAFEANWADACKIDDQIAAKTNVAIEHAPVLMPAHMDQLVQTSPRPTPSADPDISLFLHGPQRARREVRVCWRADIVGVLENSGAAFEQSNVPEAVIRALQALSPTTAECVSVSIGVVTRWFKGLDLGDQELSDVEGVRDRPSDNESDAIDESRAGVIFRGPRQQVLITANTVSRLRPDDVVVIPVQAGGWAEMAHLPDAPTEDSRKPARRPNETGEPTDPVFALASVDVANTAHHQARAQCCVRLHKGLARNVNEQKLIHELLRRLGVLAQEFSTPTPGEISAAIEAVKELSGHPDEELLTSLDSIVGVPHTVTRYGEALAFVAARDVAGVREVTGGFDEDELAPVGDDLITAASLESHTLDVCAQLTRTLDAMPSLDHRRSVLVESAIRHDWGKVDRRFQADLRGADIRLMSPEAKPMAKSVQGNRPALSVRNRNAPKGFRHEALSAELSACFDQELSLDSDPLLGHLVRSHHGFARPLLPVVEDPTPPLAELDLLGRKVAMPVATRKAVTPGHALHGACCSEFWRVIRSEGWWEAAWLETQLRLADWSASASPGLGSITKVTLPETQSDSTEKRSDSRACVATPGLDGSNPLGYLAALGLFRLLTSCGMPDATMRWSSHGAGCWHPVYELPHGVVFDQDSLLDWLENALIGDGSEHPLSRLDAEPSESFLPGQGNVYARSLTKDGSFYGLDRWLSAIGSDLAPKSVNSQLQTARRDYFVGGVIAVVEITERVHLQRTLFSVWDYQDPIEKVSLHLEPREDRRHAYQWDRPSGDPSRGLSGGMIGANRLAMEAWPLFPGKSILDTADKGGGYTIQTLGFEGHRAFNTRWIYPLWDGAISIDSFATVLGLDELRVLERIERESRARAMGVDVDDKSSLRGRAERRLELLKTLHRFGVIACFVSQRRLVGKTPNLSEPEALFVRGLQEVGANFDIEGVATTS